MFEDSIPRGIVRDGDGFSQDPRGGHGPLGMISFSGEGVLVMAIASWQNICQTEGERDGIVEGRPMKADYILVDNLKTQNAQCKQIFHTSLLRVTDSDYLLPQVTDSLSILECKRERNDLVY